MKIAILTSGRFHVCDLARELDRLGHEVSFYSCVPKHRTRAFGLPDHCARSLFWLLAPLYGLMLKCQNTRFRHVAETMLMEALDNLAARVIGPCDVFIGMSGMSTRTAAAVRRKYGARIWIERGSRHILSQQEILMSIPGGNPNPVSGPTVRRELAEYQMADTIVVPSRHAEVSFLERGFSPEKVFRNPFGVDLTMFPPTQRPANRQRVLVFIGSWSMQKGCDVLWEACRSANSWRLLHIGAINDAPVPDSPLFEHREPLPQWRLVDMFRESDVFVIASRQEGLSLVQAQALACGLPVVCTDRTGGADLRAMLDDPRWVEVATHGDPVALGRAIEKALALAATQTGVRDILGPARDRFSWKAYGERYSTELGARAGGRLAPGERRP